MLFADQLRSGRLGELTGKGNLWPGRIESALALARRPLDRAYERRATGLSALAALSQDTARAASADGHERRPAKSRVLVASLRGWSVHSAYELTIAQALRLRGAEVTLLTCGGGLPACELGWARSAYPRPCDRCAWLTDRVARASGLEHRRLGALLPWDSDARAAPAHEKAGDEQAHHREISHVSASWLLKATRPDLVPGAESVIEDFAVAAEGLQAAATALLDELRPDVVFMLNGLFAAERTIRELALARGLRAPTYEIAPRGGAIVLSQDAPAPDYRVDRLWREVRHRPLSRRQHSETIALLRDRAQGVGAHESYYEHVQDDPSELRRRLALGERERIVSLFTNVIWDSATLGHDLAFESMFDWAEQAVRLAAEQEMALVVRIHPAERRWGTRERLRDVLVSRIGELPPNVRLVGAEEPLSSYVLLEASELVLTYTTTVGLEAAAQGKRVAVAGDTHYRERGFTFDIARPEQLAQVLARPLPPPSLAEVDLAVRYAHMFFFRAMIPFPAVRAQGGRVVRLPSGAAELAPGADAYLDWICDRILDGGEFGLPDRLAHATTAGLEQKCESAAPPAAVVGQ
jgi:hypothetical protein